MPTTCLLHPAMRRESLAKGRFHGIGVLVGAMPKQEQERYLLGLTTIFEPLRARLGDSMFGEDAIDRWDRQRRACSMRHFNTYFRFTPDYNVLPRAERDEIIARIGEKAFMREKLRESISEKMPDGSNRFQLILREIECFKKEVRKGEFQNFIEVIFEMADSLDTTEFSGLNFASRGNLNEIKSIVLSLTEIMNITDRSKIFLAAARQASLGWRVDFAEFAMEQHRPKSPHAQTPSEKRLVCLDTAENLVQEALVAIREAAKSGALRESRRLLKQLLKWREWAGDDGKEVLAWTAEQLEHRGVPELFAAAFTIRREETQQNNGFACRNFRYSVKRAALKTIIDTELFLKKLAPLKANESVARFLEAWDSAAKAPDNPA